MAVAMTERTSMKKIAPSDLRTQAKAMIRDGTMPSLETLLQAIADVREKYVEQLTRIQFNRDTAS
jgi:predicted rRNA methylase YqxC with S4 and FtsJ domains